MATKMSTGGLIKTLAAVAVLITVGGGMVLGDISNVALNKDVTLDGAPFFTDGWGNGQIVDKQTIVDGLFFPEGHQWDQGPVWWDCHDGRQRYITISLAGTYEIESFVVQGDNNDDYRLYYWNINSDIWELAWDIGNYSSWGWGMQTRPNPLDDTERYLLPTSIVTDALKIEGVMTDSDEYFSVSEVQAYGILIPEPVSICLLAIGGLALLRRKSA